MPTLYHHPLCPHSRFVRLILAEYGIETTLIEERAAERRREFLTLDPAGRTPLLVDDDGSVIPGASVIVEYLEDCLPSDFTGLRLMPRGLRERVETRRLIDWFNVKFFDEVTNYLVTRESLQALPRSPRSAAARRTWTCCGSRAPICVPISAISAI